ncbi:arginine--tRNA ligase [bacterium]|nr:arginine--tRNA ligase [bacterium]
MFSQPKGMIDSMINKEVTDLVSETLTSLGFEGEVVLEHPNDLLHGDFSCNIAMVLAKQVGKNPRELAEEIVSKIEEHEYIEKVEVAGPGFINFYLASTFFTQKTKEILKQGEEWGKTTRDAGKTMLFEHSSPNLFKPFHIGHLVNNTLGESLIRIFRATGTTVVPLSYPSDVSPGIAKAVWAILDKGWQDDITVARIGEAYAHGVAQYKENEEIQKEINEINASLYNQETDTQFWSVYEKGRALSLDYFTAITSRLGSEFDELIFESEAEKEGKEIIKKHTPRVFEESDGAIIFRGSEHGLFDNVFINSAGFGTYLAKDIGLLSLKFDKYTFDTSITITDIEQKHHFQLVKKAAELINKEWAEKSEYIQHGRLELTTGKISSRSGNVPLAEDILDSVRERAHERMQENNRVDDEMVAEHVAVSAIKYAIARVGMGKNIVFDMEQALSFEGDSGPYLQYTYARTQSILQKANEATPEISSRGGLAIVAVEQLLYRFPEAVERAANEYEPHYVANYLSDLASAYNSWYANEQVLDGSDAQNYKLGLTEAVGATLKKGLWLLGIETPERM